MRFPSQWYLPPLVVVASLACSDSDTGLTVARTASSSGEGQSAATSSPLAEPLRVIVTDAGDPVSGITVNWSTPDGGTFNPTSSTTGVDGIATSAWTLGPTAGSQDAQAAVNGASGSPVAFTATALPLSPIINVDNNTFSPSAVSILVGGSVTFLWTAGSVSHTVTPATGNASALPISPGSPTPLDAPQQFTANFPAAGVFRFFCVVHGSSPTPTTVAGMSGTVTVN